MTRSSAEIDVLRQIRQAPGRLSWYQIDRSLSASGVRPAEGVMRLLKRLEAEGLIRSVPGAVAAQPCYELTDAGASEASERSA
jgi:DNA-binding PadR family transcriptional regulator